MRIHSRSFAKKLKTGFASLFATAVFLSLHSCTGTEQGSGVFGKYKAFSDDPAINKFLAGEDNYLELRNDQTIVYNTTINSKPKFHFTGTFNFDEQSKTLNINWTEGKLPNKLTVEKKDKNQFIKIGETNYVKQKPD